MPSLRQQDNQVEKAVAEYLDSNYYSEHVKNFIRYTDFDTQMKGVDVSFTDKKGDNIKVDEKCLAHYINRNLPTFAFEINFISTSGQLVEGWFYDENKITDYYLLIWITANKNENISKNDIIQLDAILISRKKIQTYLAAFQLNKTIINNYSRIIRQNGQQGVHYRSQEKPFYFYLSNQLVEKPLNLVIKRRQLEILADEVFQIRH